MKSLAPETFYRDWARGEAKEKAPAVTSWEKMVAETSVIAEEVVRSGLFKGLI